MRNRHIFRLASLLTSIIFIGTNYLADTLVPELRADEPIPVKPTAATAQPITTATTAPIAAEPPTNSSHTDMEPTAPALSPMGEFTVYGYCKCAICCGAWSDVPSPDKIPGECVAADPDVLPKGTRIYIDGIGERVVMDTGGGIKGNVLDVLYADHEMAKAHEKQTLKVWRLE